MLEEFIKWKRMKISAFTGFNLCQFTPKYDYKREAKPNILQKDSFHSQKRLTPSFCGVIPRKRIINSCKQLEKQVKKISEPEQVKELQEIIRDFFSTKLFNLLNPDTKMPSNEQMALRIFRHELGNLCTKPRMVICDYTKDLISEKYFPVRTDEEHLIFLKSKIRKIIQIIENCTEEHATLEAWRKHPDIEVPAMDVFNLRMKILEFIEHPRISVTGKNLLLGKSVKNPALLYDLVSQPFLNAIKYSEGKRIRIIIKQVRVDGKIKYYISFINLGTNPLSKSEIIELRKGKIGYRTEAAAASDIEGTGIGVAELVRIIKKIGHEKDIEFLFEEDRVSGVHTCIEAYGLH